MPYLITGATGDIGSKVTNLLIQRNERPRIFVRDTQKAKTLFGDRADIFVGNLNDPDSLFAALQGAHTLFLVNSGPQIPVRDSLAATLAKSAGVQHIVKLSSLDARHGLAIGAWHERGEAAVRASGVHCTFLQPTGFMSNLLAWAHSIKSEGIVRSSTAGGRRPFIHSDDIAAVAVAALTNRVRQGQPLQLTGPEALTFPEITQKISAALNRPLRFVPISDDEARQRYSRISGYPEETEAHVALWRAIRENRLTTLTNTVQRVLGRPPLTLDHWLNENLDAFR
jgi:uncharacterized protein YbjT (DUF2867 family)